VFRVVLPEEPRAPFTLAAGDEEVVVQQPRIPELAAVAAPAPVRRRREPELFSRIFALELDPALREQGPLAGVGPERDE
jgi:hypothetical protein